MRKQPLVILSFTPDANQHLRVCDRAEGETRFVAGIATVTLLGETRDVWAVQEIYSATGALRCTDVHSIAMRYPSGTKSWEGYATVWADGNVQFWGGYLDGRVRGRAPIVTGFYPAKARV